MLQFKKYLSASAIWRFFIHLIFKLGLVVLSGVFLTVILPRGIYYHNLSNHNPFKSGERMTSLVASTHRTRVEASFTWNINAFETLLDRSVTAGPYVVTHEDLNRPWEWYVTCYNHCDLNPPYLDLSLKLSDKKGDVQKCNFDGSCKVILGDPTAALITEEQGLRNCSLKRHGHCRTLWYECTPVTIQIPFKKNLSKSRVLVNGNLQITVNLVILLAPTTTPANPGVVTTFQESSKLTNRKWKKELFYKLYNDGSYSDVNLLCGKNTYRCHKCILSQSSVFAAMFQSEMKESLTNEVIISDIDSSALEMFIKSLYGQKFTVPEDSDELLKLLYCAEKYDVLRLKQVCLREMLRGLNEQNAAEFTIAVYKVCQDDDLCQQFRSYCHRNISKLLENSDFKQLYKSNLDAFI